MAPCGAAEADYYARETGVTVVETQVRGGGHWATGSDSDRILARLEGQTCWLPVVGQEDSLHRTVSEAGLRGDTSIALNLLGEL